MAVGGAGCVWSSYLGDDELDFFAKGTADHHNAHERLILIRQPHAHLLYSNACMPAQHPVPVSCLSGRTIILFRQCADRLTRCAVKVLM